jgi:hypothetical protein
VKNYENIEDKPGIKYSANAQCTLFFGKPTESCVRKTVSPIFFMMCSSSGGSRDFSKGEGVGSTI